MYYFKNNFTIDAVFIGLKFFILFKFCVIYISNYIIFLIEEREKVVKKTIVDVNHMETNGMILYAILSNLWRRTK